MGKLVTRILPTFGAEYRSLRKGSKKVRVIGYAPNNEYLILRLVKPTAKEARERVIMIDHFWRFYEEIR